MRDVWGGRAEQEMEEESDDEKRRYDQRCNQAPSAGCGCVRAYLSGAVLDDKLSELLVRHLP